MFRVTRHLSVGSLCVIAPRGRNVFGYEFFGSYPTPDGKDYRHLKTTGHMIRMFRSGEIDESKCFPYLSMSGKLLEAGTSVMVTHSPVRIDKVNVRRHLRMSRQTTLTEVLTHEGETRWVKTGLLRDVK